MLKCCNNDDIVTLKADDNGDTMTFMFENQSQDRISDFELKLMDIDSEHLGIPGDRPPVAPLVSARRTLPKCLHSLSPPPPSCPPAASEADARVAQCPLHVIALKLSPLAPRRPQRPTTSR